MKQLLSLIFLVLQISVFSQGTNNEQKYDQKDLNFLFQQNKIEVFKFAFRSKKDTCFNVIVEEYISGKKTKTLDFFERTKPVVDMMDEPFSNFFPLLTDTSDTWVRFYFKNSPNRIEITPVIGDIQSPFIFNDSLVKGDGSRAFDDLPKYLKKREPLIVYYSNREGDIISCPAGIKLSEIPENYFHVIIVYADLIARKK
jgi:hypothetical protein